MTNETEMAGASAEVAGAPAEMAGASAEVRTEGRVIRYRRSGAGPPVLLLAAPADRDALWDALAGGLGGFRRIEPELPDPDADPLAWLDAFLEALGTPRLTVLAAGAYCACVVELARADPHRFARTVLVRGPGAPGAA